MVDESNQAQAAHHAAEEPRDNLFLRGDTILGVCEGIGQDFGFHPNWLRAVFAATFYWSPVGVIAAYLALGVLVAISRLIFPVRRTALSQQVPDAASHAPIASEPAEQESLPLAA